MKVRMTKKFAQQYAHLSPEEQAAVDKMMQELAAAEDPRMLCTPVSAEEAVELSLDRGELEVEPEQ